MAVNDVFKVALVGGLFEQEIVNVFHYQQTTANTSGISETESLARAFFNSMITPLRACLSYEMQWGTIEARSVVVPPIPPVGYDYAITQQGEGEDVSMPPTVAAIIKKKTAFLGRKYRGRNYFAGIPRDSVENGQIISGVLSVWETLRDAMAATITWTAGGSPGFRPVIAAYTYSSGDDPVIDGIRVTPITSGEVDTVLRSQRRRELGVGA